MLLLYINYKRNIDFREKEYKYLFHVLIYKYTTVNGCIPCIAVEACLCMAVFVKEIQFLFHYILINFTNQWILRWILFNCYFIIQFNFLNNLVTELVFIALTHSSYSFEFQMEQVNNTFLTFKSSEKLLLRRSDIILPNLTS